jgi:hypothetical protein
MKFPAVEDIPNIETSRVNVKTIDPLLYDTVNSLLFSLKHRNNFKVMPTAHHERNLVAILRTQIDLFSITHKSIRILLRRAYREPDKRLISDAASLVREQIEKLFVIALVLDNPGKWFRQYMRSGLKSDVIEYLVAVDEHSEIPRFHELLKESYPAFIKSAQRPKVPGQKQVTIASDFAVRALRHHLESAGPDPKWFKDALKKRKKKKNQELRSFVRDYFDFPTPGRSIGILRDDKIKPFLRRWHKEYSFVCQYTHVALGKGMLATLSEFKDKERGDLMDDYAQKLSGRIIFTSHTAAASACAIVVHALVNDYGAEEQIKGYWDQLHTRALPAKAFWNLYIRDLLE